MIPLPHPQTHRLGRETIDLRLAGKTMGVSIALLAVINCAKAPGSVEPGTTADLPATSGTQSSSTGELSAEPTSSGGATTTTTGEHATTRDKCVDLQGKPCSIWEQDCPAGEKCVRYAECGSPTWTKEMCVPVAPNPAHVGEPCTTESYGGIDNCDRGSQCFPAGGEKEGTCVALCLGDPQQYHCTDPGTLCFVDAGSDSIGWCLEACDPILVDCSHDQDLCLYAYSANGFVCFTPREGLEGVLQVHEECSFERQCAKGLFCAVLWVAVECDQGGIGCCERYCDLTQAPDVFCEGAMQECEPFYGKEPAPVGQEHIGVCTLPL